MRKFPRNKADDGAIMIMVAVGLLVILAFLIIAIDLPMMLLAKSQLQNAADAGALAGAVAYAQSNGDHTVCRNAAIEVAGMNRAVQDIQSPVVITAADITFPGDDIVRVITHRTAATGDPLTLHFMRVVDPNSDNLGRITAVAAATVMAVNGSDCLKPWAYPDSFEDINANGMFDPGIDRYDSSTSYQAPRDVGNKITLKLPNPNGNLWRSGWCYAVDFAPINNHFGDPVLTGGSNYRNWIGNCEPYTVLIGDSLQIEPGNMVGPTRQGIDNLIALDPNASWDAATGTVINSNYLTSPRCIKVAAFDPTRGVLSNGRGFVVISKISVMFIERAQGNGGNSAVVGRFIKQADGDGVHCPTCPDNGFLFTTALVE